MNGIPVIAGGAAIDCKPSVIGGGVEVPVYDAYVIQGGQAIKVYQSAVEWTYAIDAQITVGALNVTSFTYGNDGANSSMASLDASHQSGGANAYCEVTYTFSSPLVMRAGQTISISTWLSAAVDITTLKINGNQVYSSGTIANGKTYTYTIPSDIAISSLSVRCNPQVGNYIREDVTVQVTVNADIGSFLLNNSGTSNQ